MLGKPTPAVLLRCAALVPLVLLQSCLTQLLWHHHDSHQREDRAVAATVPAVTIGPDGTVTLQVSGPLTGLATELARELPPGPEVPFTLLPDDRQAAGQATALLEPDLGLRRLRAVLQHEQPLAHPVARTARLVLEGETSLPALERHASPDEARALGLVEAWRAPGRLPEPFDDLHERLLERDPGAAGRGFSVLLGVLGPDAVVVTDPVELARLGAAAAAAPDFAARCRELAPLEVLVRRCTVDGSALIRLRAGPALALAAADCAPAWPILVWRWTGHAAFAMGRNSAGSRRVPIADGEASVRTVIWRSAPSGVWWRVLLTPVAVALDAVLVAGVVWGVAHGALGGCDDDG